MVKDVAEQLNVILVERSGFEHSVAEVRKHVEGIMVEAVKAVGIGIVCGKFLPFKMEYDAVKYLAQGTVFHIPLPEHLRELLNNAPHDIEVIALKQKRLPAVVRLQLFFDLRQHVEMIKSRRVLGKRGTQNLVRSGAVPVKIESVATFQSVPHGVVEHRVVGGDDKEWIAQRVLNVGGGESAANILVAFVDELEKLAGKKDDVVVVKRRHGIVYVDIADAFEFVVPRQNQLHNITEHAPHEEAFFTTGNFDMIGCFAVVHLAGKPDFTGYVIARNHKFALVVVVIVFKVRFESGQCSQIGVDALVIIVTGESLDQFRIGIDDHISFGVVFKVIMPSEKVFGKSVIIERVMFAANTVFVCKPIRQSGFAGTVKGKEQCAVSELNPFLGVSPETELFSDGVYDLI